MPALRLCHHPPSVTPADHQEACAFPGAPETAVGTGPAPSSSTPSTRSAMRASPPPGFCNCKALGKSGGSPRSAPIRGTPWAPPLRRHGGPRKCLRRGTWPVIVKNRARRPGKFNWEVSRGSEDPICRAQRPALFFTNFQTNCNKILWPLQKKIQHLVYLCTCYPQFCPHLGHRFAPPNPCPPLQAPLSHGFGMAPGTVDRIARRGTNP